MHIAANNKLTFLLAALCPLFQPNLLQAVNGLQIGPLLSTCVDACQRGCAEIRSVQACRERTGDDLKFELKDSSDSRSALTEADGKAQRAIIGALRAEWGDDLRIVGEEDNDEVFTDDDDKTEFEPLRRDLFDDDIGETAEIEIADFTIFVDPLDGTREFVEGRLANCQSLVGVAMNGKSIGGAIGIPFPAGDLSTEATIVYGIAEMGTGTLGAPLTRGPFPLDRNIDGVKYPRPHIATGDSTAPIMTACKEAIIKPLKGSNVLYGGAGNKILAAALGEVACSIQHTYGGPWDLCAPEAILTAMGGRITDLFGDEIAIYGDDAPPRCNERGYVVTPPGSTIDHDAITAKLLATPFVQEYQKSLNEAE
eukprot:CAMPEP_0195529646 /NCGR_PEP_ID=MMETSP0794_2-20130614/32269_1 /TAXON_ID=515487 /ORGANISM="Stephanopyxis turris, Strain CCMP 815" /LENGTH=366 /DNA_ID=CAMNT_0040660993 /DNA_START=34 /DNA_END=1134 /DNA_ORIENTATION=-